MYTYDSGVDKYVCTKGSRANTMSPMNDIMRRDSVALGR